MAHSSGVRKAVDARESDIRTWGSPRIQCRGAQRTNSRSRRRSTWKGHLGPEAHLVASTHRFTSLLRACSESRSTTNSSSSSDLAPHFALRSELSSQKDDATGRVWVP